MSKEKLETGTHTANLDLSAKAFGSTEGASDDGLKVRHEASEKDVQQMKDGLSKVEKLEQRADHSRRAEMPRPVTDATIAGIAQRVAYAYNAYGDDEAEKVLWRELKKYWPITPKVAGRGEAAEQEQNKAANGGTSAAVRTSSAQDGTASKESNRNSSPEPRPAPPPLEEKGRALAEMPFREILEDIMHDDTVWTRLPRETRTQIADILGIKEGS